MFQQEEIPLYSRPISHSYTQNIIDIDTDETVATVTTVTVLDNAGHAKVKVMSGMEHIDSTEGSRSMDRLLEEGNLKLY
jgi:hypothetical protein